MARFLLRRFVMLIATLLVSSFLIYSSLYLAPGNPIATLSGGRALPPASVAILEERYHLDKPFLVRYWEWLKGVVHGDLGLSIGQRQEVSSLITARIGITLELVAYASLIILVVGIGLGVLAGLRPGGLDTSILVLTTVLAALPAFVAATMLMSTFSVRLGWFPAFGNGEGVFDRISSVGMFEHVGLKNLRTYFDGIHRLLKPGGIALNHGITSSSVIPVSASWARRAAAASQVPSGVKVPTCIS